MYSAPSQVFLTSAVTCHNQTGASFGISYLQPEVAEAEKKKRSLPVLFGCCTWLKAPREELSASITVKKVKHQLELPDTPRSRFSLAAQRARRLVHDHDSFLFDPG